ncbi:hypothetical protein NBRC106471_2787 [Acetobacter pasteurianus subsp. pasteurianus LMG 1262 = NBRC 106471]|nr:hypothetical protein NBRC106471_2787 [Acetobacter pasteurianus subsp. pasteurianus LMG 1262 = NBRC 106471]
MTEGRPDPPAYLTPDPAYSVGDAAITDALDAARSFKPLPPQLTRDWVLQNAGPQETISDKKQSPSPSFFINGIAH